MSDQISSEEAGEIELMARHGITRRSVHQYRYKFWRYARLADAIAQAKRDT